MINFINIKNIEPYLKFKQIYELALSKNQNAIEAISIASFNKELNQVDSRFVNLKYIIDEEWVFFSNYDSKKAKDFISHPQVSCLFYWDKINYQIRMKANIFKSDKMLSDKHYKRRSHKKNTLAWSSNQSQSINSYEEVVKQYDLESVNYNQQRPDFWGGFSFVPYYFEFWEGNDNRLNKREVFTLVENNWEISFLQP